jgi:hypothetical protein
VAGFEESSKEASRTRSKMHSESPLLCQFFGLIYAWLLPTGDNTLIQRYLHWEPDTTLREGLEKTYAWIHDQYLARQRGEAGVVPEAEVSR